MSKRKNSNRKIGWKKKKQLKKLGCKSYYEYRRKKIILAASEAIGEVEPGCFNMIHIIDSRKMNLKHPHSVKVFRNCYPTGMNIASDSKEKEIEFQCTSVLENEKVKSVASNYTQRLNALCEGLKDSQEGETPPFFESCTEMLEAWIKGIQDPDACIKEQISGITKEVKK